MVFFAYFVTILLAFGGLINTFFQQDEWATFGNSIYFHLTGASLKEIILPVGGLQHFFPLSRLLPKLMADWFGLKYPAWAGLSLLFHLITVYFVYVFIRLLFKRRGFAFIGGLFFAFHSVAVQPVFWSGAGLGTQAATLFMTLALIGFIKYLRTRNQKGWLILFFSSFLVSLGFKETTLFLFVFMPIWWLIENKTIKLKEIIRVFWPMVIFGFFYFGLRLLLFLNAPPLHGTSQELSQPGMKEVYFYRLVTVPAKILSQSFIPSPIIVNVASLIVKFGYPQFVASDNQPNPFIVESVGADTLSYGLAIMIMGFCFLAYRYFKSQEKSLPACLLIIGLLFVGLASTPLIFIPGKAGYFSLVEGRHLYLINIGLSLLLVIMMYFIIERFKLGKFFVIGLFGLGLAYHLVMINQQVSQIKIIGKIRKAIVNQITNSYPQLPSKVIFYTESDKAYYGLSDEEKVLPFQSGFGQTLMVTYFYQGEKLPACFFDPQEDYLFAIDEQDYRECQGRGFGYFRKYLDLKQAVEDYQLKPENVIAFAFDSQINRLSDITDQVRKKLAEDDHKH